MRSATREEPARGAAREDGVCVSTREEGGRGANGAHLSHAATQSRDAARASSAYRRELKVVLAWTLAAFALRLAVLLCFEQVISPDGVEYVAHARRLAAGDIAGGMSAYWPPLYPALVGLASLVFRDAEFAGRFVSTLAGALLVVPAHRLARRWYGRRVARTCAALLAPRWQRNDESTAERPSSVARPRMPQSG